MGEKIKLHILYPIASAWKRVSRHISHFIPFLFALLLIQGVLFITLFFFETNAKNEKDLIRSEYDYHLQITGLTDYQAMKLEEKLFPTTTNSEISERKYLIKHDLDTSKPSDEVYDAYYFLITGNKDYGFLSFIPDDLESNYESFLYRTASVLKEEGNPIITTSPLYELSARMARQQVYCALLVLVLAAVSILILVALFNIRANSCKFTYGMYSSCGATSRKLEGIAFCELLICTALTIIPAFLLSLLACYFIFTAQNIVFYFTVSRALFEIPTILLVLFLSVCPAMKMLARKEPNALLRAEDNSNLITPPRKSIFLHTKTFPRDYERITARRFGRYHIRLAITSALLCTVFVSGLYVTEVYQKETALSADIAHDFTFTFKEQTYIDDVTADKFKNTTGVDRVHKSYSSIDAFDLTSHVLLKKEDVKILSGLSSYPKNNAYCVTNDVQYMAAMDMDIFNLLSETYRIEGDPSAVLADDRTIVIGAGYQNRDVLDYQVGDSVFIGIYTEEPPPEDYELVTDENGKESWILKEPETELIDESSTTMNEVVSNMVSGDELLMQQIEKYRFVYREVKVAAVIYGYPSAKNGIPIIMNADCYKSVTEEAPTANTLYIYADKDAKGNDIAMLEGTLHHYTYLFDDTESVATGARLENRLTELSQYDNLLILLAWFAILFVPLIWLYSHIMFYIKRENEFYILQSIAADMRAIRRLHLQSVLIMIPLAAFSLLTAALSTFLAYLAFTYMLPLVFSVGSAVVSGFSVSPVAYIICFLLTFISSLLSAYIPYLIYRAKHRTDAPSADVPMDE